MTANKLKLKPVKTEFVVCVQSTHVFKVGKNVQVNILGTSVRLTDTVKNLGVWFDSDFTSLKHPKSIYKSCSPHVRNLHRLGQYHSC